MATQIYIGQSIRWFGRGTRCVTCLQSL